MIKRTLLVALLFGSSIVIKAQSAADVKAQLDAANAAMTKKDFRTADKSIAQAMFALSKFAGKELAKMLPLELNGFKSVPEKDLIQMGNSIMAAGNNIQRSYSSADGLKKIEIKIRPSAPELATISMFISNPVYLKTEGPLTEKVVRINGRNALVKINDDLKTSELHIVSGNTLYTLETSGESYKVEDLTALAAKIEVGKMETILK